MLITTIDRYIFRELVKVFLISVGSLTLLFYLDKFLFIAEMVVSRVNDATRKMVKKDYFEIINKPLDRVLDCKNDENSFESVIKTALDGQTSVHEIEIHPTLIIDDQQRCP